MQQKINPKRTGFAVIFRKDALKFASQWHKSMLVHESWIHSIELMAADPEFYRKSFSGEFWVCYLENPDLTAALLNLLREKWSQLDKSKAGKLKKFLAQNNSVKWERGISKDSLHRGSVNISRLQDGEIAKAFENSPGGVAVSVSDVVKARKWVAANILDGEKFAKNALAKDGTLHVTGKPNRREQGGNNLKVLSF